MKVSCLVLFVIGGALTLGASDATASNPAPLQSQAAVKTPSEHPIGVTSLDSANPPASAVRVGKRRVQQRNAKANHVPFPSRVAKTNRLKHLTNGQARSTIATPRLQPQSRLNQSAVVAKKGSIQDKSVASVPSVQRQSMFPSSSPSLDNLRHRGPNPAMIGGLGTSKAGETGAINGSRISRKP
jgi:hypothetical protein